MPNARRQKLAEWIALQTATGIPASANHEIADLTVYPIREPGSGRTYTVIRLRTRSGLTGWGEAGPVIAADIAKARAAMVGKAATAFAVLSSGTPLDPALNCAMLDITAKACSTPVADLFLSEPS